MNRSALKKYAPQARLDFIEAVTQRARRLGLDPTLPVSVEQTGDVLLIAGQPFLASVAKQRSELARRIQQQGFNAVVEALAYTWFNRLVAIRFMELKGYLSHGYRVLSHPQGQQPEILDHVQHLDLPGLDKAEVIRLKTAGNQDEALYREILLAQCHELHRNMPFLFESLDDATELLLPDNLLRTDSLIARLVGDIEEADWQEVEVIGWLYQFYISDKKDEVIGKVVKSEDIPAATQLFTPNWIVQYLVQNSLGRLWLMANPGSNLKDKMPYYIEPAEQAPEAQAQLDALIKVRMDEDGGTLNPESLTVLDPACGSGHILVEAYNLLRAIYEERGYRLRDIPRLILQKNLFGLDIDDRAAQLAGFALLMKAREDDRRLFDDEGNPPRLNVMAIQQSAGLPDEEIAEAIISAAISIDGGETFHSDQLFGGVQLETLHSSGLVARDLRELIQLFQYGKTFGSLISVPSSLSIKLSAIIGLLNIVRAQGDDLSRNYANEVLVKFALPASLLALQYDAVMVNPPYMGSGYFNEALKSGLKSRYKVTRSDLYAIFIERALDFISNSGALSMISMQSWMFTTSYRELRESLLERRLLLNLVQLGTRAFDSISGEMVSTAMFCFMRSSVAGYKSGFRRLTEGVSQEKVDSFSDKDKCYTFLQNDFSRVPGSPLVYWKGMSLILIFERLKPVGDLALVREGIHTGANDLYVRRWWEVDLGKLGLFEDSYESISRNGSKWIPYNKGGGCVRWYGNNEYVIAFDEKSRDEMSLLSGHVRPSQGIYFKEGGTWSDIGTKGFGVKYYPQGFLFADKGPVCVGGDVKILIAGFNSSPFMYLAEILMPTISYKCGTVKSIPFPNLDNRAAVLALASRAIDLSRKDWDGYEASWDFDKSVLLREDNRKENLSSSWSRYSDSCLLAVSDLKKIETENNSIFIRAYGLEDELSSEFNEAQVELSRADREKDMQRLVSYAIGCMMGRYSLDEPGLIYAHSGNIGFDPSRYSKLPADADGIIPVTDGSWFEDDAAERVREFVKVVWGAETLLENMEWLADSLGRKAGESADEAIRRYLSSNFYKDHLQTYKKRPIYWLFSSGKQKAFECLVYLHRYNEGTLSRMRMEYVVPLQSRMQARIDKLSDDIDSATSSAQQKALQKRKDKLTKQLEELRRFDENLRPYADQRITLDLDDGVKVNYGKFGNLLAEVKAITGGKEE